MTAMTVATDTSQFRFGTQSLSVSTGNTGNNGIYPTANMTAVPGQFYTFSCYIKTKALITGGYIALRLCPGGSLTQFAESSVHITDTSASTDNGWTRVILTAAAPAGVFSIRPVVVYTGTTAGQIFWIDGIKHEPGSVASVWQENFVSGLATHDPIGSMIDASRGGVWRVIGSLGGPRDTVQIGANGLIFGGDTELYSPATGVLTIPDTGLNLPQLRLGDDSALFDVDIADRLGIMGQQTPANGGFVFGSGKDTNLYRSAAGTLKTDGSLDVGGAVIGASPILRGYSTGASTWNKPSGLNHIIVEVQGGGGAGGGAPTGAAGEHAKGGGGGSGGFSRSLILAGALSASYTATVGAGGTGVSGTTGNAGADSSFGALVIGKGGTGGASSASNTATYSGALGGAGGVLGAGDLQTAGQVGGWGFGSGALATGGVGAPGSSGGGGQAGAAISQPASSVGAAGESNCGGGGGGSVRTGTGAANAGGAGGSGFVLVWEFYGP